MSADNSPKKGRTVSVGSGGWFGSSFITSASPNSHAVSQQSGQSDDLSSLSGERQSHPLGPISFPLRDEAALRHKLEEAGTISTISLAAMIAAAHLLFWTAALFLPESLQLTLPEFGHELLSVLLPLALAVVQIAWICRQPSSLPNIRDDARPLGAVASGAWLGKPSENLTKTTNPLNE